VSRRTWIILVVVLVVSGAFVYWKWEDIINLFVGGVESES